MLRLKKTPPIDKPVWWIWASHQCLRESCLRLSDPKPHQQHMVASISLVLTLASEPGPQWMRGPKPERWSFGSDPIGTDVLQRHSQANFRWNANHNSAKPDRHNGPALRSSDARVGHHLREGCALRFWRSPKKTRSSTQYAVNDLASPGYWNRLAPSGI